LEIGQFNGWLEAANMSHDPNGSPIRLVVLVNPQGQILHHPYLTQEALKLRLKRRDSLQADPAVSKLLVDKQAEEYSDPIRRGVPFVAAAAELPSRRHKGWFVLVEQREEEALRPVHELTDHFNYLAAIALAVGVVVVLALWLVLFRVIRAASGLRTFPKAAAPQAELP